MEYLVGSLSTFVILYFSAKIFFSKETYKKSTDTFKYSQSHIHEIIKPLLPPMKFMAKKPDRQSSRHEEKTNVKVIILDNTAYWIKDNLFYSASLDNDKIDVDSTKVLDIINMDKVQLDKIMFIVDRLREGK